MKKMIVFSLVFIQLSILGFLFALNGRYKIIADRGAILDSWTGTIIVGTSHRRTLKSIPYRDEINRSQSRNIDQYLSAEVENEPIRERPSLDEIAENFYKNRPSIDEVVARYYSQQKQDNPDQPKQRRSIEEILYGGNQ